MSIHRDDPRWTAYVLGELTDTERAEVDLELESSPEAREIVDEIRMMTGLLKDELAKQPDLTLAPEQRQAVLQSVPATTARTPAWWQHPRWIGLAAGVAAAAIVFSVAIPRMERPAGRLAPPTVPLATSNRPPETAAIPPAGAAIQKESRSGGRKSERPVQTADEARPQSTVPPAAAPIPQAVPDVALQPVMQAAGSIAGVVSDTIGAVIPGVEVTVTGRTLAGGARTTVTDEQGRFAFANLPDGDYKLSSALPGFNTKNQIVHVERAQTATADQEMEVASASEEVTVTSQAPAIDLSGKGGSMAVASGGALRGGFFGRNRGVAPMPVPPPPPAVRAMGGTPANLWNNWNGYPRNTASYGHLNDNSFETVAQQPLATFSVDVDTASYSNVRRFLNQYQLPPRDAVRIEEMVNYFDYNYPGTFGGIHPISVQSEVASAPWNPAHRLVRIGVKAKEVDVRKRPPTNLVFLIDVSGSMMPPERLPLLKNALRMLVEQLSENDRVSIVTYAGNSGLALPPTTGDHKREILGALDRLEAGGSTNGGAGIALAYQIAVSNLVRGGVNRVILCTDGDFNVGVTSQGELTRMIEERAKSGVFLSVLGVGTGNLKDSTMERLADHGNGNYAYLDSLNEAHKVLVEQVGGTLQTVAKDVKIQVDFNPAQVAAYRLIGYEDRVLQAQDFNNDAKDAGDMGAGQTVTALFEIVPPGVAIEGGGVDPSKYQQPPVVKANPSASRELLTVRVRYKKPDAADSTRFDVPLVDREATFNNASSDFQFASAVAEFGMILRGSPYRGNASLDQVLELADRNRGADRNGYRAEFAGLVRVARQLTGRE